MWNKCFKRISADHHESCASPLYLEWLFWVNHFVAFQFVDVEDASQFVQFFVVQHSALLYPPPVNTFHGYTTCNQRLVCLNHFDNIAGAKLLVSVNKQKMACVCLQEMMRNRIAATLKMKKVKDKIDDLEFELYVKKAERNQLNLEIFTNRKLDVYV